MHSTEEILRASAAWYWVPRDGEHESAEMQLVRYPERFGGGVRGSLVDAQRPAREVLDHALERTRAWGADTFTFWTNASDSPDLEEELLARGAEHIDTVTVFARGIDDASVAVPDSVTAEIVRTLDQVREVDVINGPVWEQSSLDERGLREELAEIVQGLSKREGFRVLARIDGNAVSTAGCTVIDGFARLWGGATLASARGKGAYRATLAERLREAAEWGASTALVKGRVSTSAPILARQGFQQYGDERAYRIRLE